MKTCKTCVFWGKRTKPKYRVCDSPKTVSQIGEDSVWLGKRGIRIQTAKNFGCIHWR